MFFQHGKEKVRKRHKLYKTSLTMKLLMMTPETSVAVPGAGNIVLMNFTFNRIPVPQGTIDPVCMLE